MSDSTAEKAWSRYSNDRLRDDGAAHHGFMAGRASRDAEVAELREQLAEARAEIERRPEPAFRDALIADRNKAESALAEAQATIEKQKGITRSMQESLHSVEAEALAETKSLREQLAGSVTTEYHDRIVNEAQQQIHKLEARAAEAQATIERVTSAVNGPHPANSGLDSFTLAHISAALSAPSSTGGNFRDDLKSRTPRRSDVDFDTATQRPLGGNDRG